MLNQSLFRLFVCLWRVKLYEDSNTRRVRSYAESALSTKKVRVYVESRQKEEELKLV